MSQLIHIPENYVLSSSTDLFGTITDATDDFIKISGYSREELIGAPHNLIRHPDVPAAAFEDLWKTIKNGKTWNFYVKNRAKNGDYYWVEANTAPVFENGQIIGYSSIRSPMDEETIKEAENAYKLVSAGKLVIEEGKLIPKWKQKLQKLNFMNNRGISFKVAFLLAFFAVIFSILFSVQVYQEYQHAKTDYIQNVSKEMQLDLQGELKSKFNFALASAMAYSSNKILQNALENNDRQLAIDELGKITKFYRDNTRFKNVKIHMHTADVRSFLRVWNPDKYGDDLSGFRNSIKQVKATQKPITLMELGRAGLTVRGIVPMFNEQKQYIGSLEVIMGLRSIAAEYDKNNLNLVTLLTDEALKIANKAANNQAIANFKLASNSWFTDTSIRLVKEINIETLITQGYLLSDTKIFSVLPELNADDRAIGYHIVARDRAELDQTLETILDDSIEQLLISLLMVLLAEIALLMLLRSYITKPLQNITQTIRKISDTGVLKYRIKKNANDELGKLTEDFNMLIQQTQVALTQVKSSLKRMSKGNLKQQIEIEMFGDYAVLKENFNHSTATMNATFEQVSSTLDHLSQAEFEKATNVDSSELEGVFKEMTDKACVTASKLHTTFTQIQKVMNLVEHGNFREKINSDSLNGDLLTLANSLNEAISGLNEFIVTAMTTSSQMAGGNLQERIEGEYHGQIASLQSALNIMADNVSVSIAQTIKTVESMNRQAGEIAEGANGLADRTQEQAASLEETAATMEQMTQTINNNAHNAEEARKQAFEAKQHSEDGVKVMNNAIEAMEEIAASSHKIEEIISLIDSIAFQTNLLALNAAVEAARAGEHGRGFAVVASEVRSLAQKSAEAASDIKVLIESSVSQIHTGTNLVGETSESLSGILGSIQKTSDVIDKISTASKEQAEGINQVNVAIAQIDGITQENAALVEETSASTNLISNQMENLDKQLALYAVSNELYEEASINDGTTFDFNIARRAHRSWKGKIRAYIEGADVGMNKASAVDFKACVLGEWFYGEGQTFAHLNSMQELELYHQEMHKLIGSVIAADELGDLEEVERLLSQLDSASEKVISCISKVESDVNHNI